MQIFVLDKNPFVSAYLLFSIDFKRGNKQIVELGQILSTVAQNKYCIIHKLLYKQCFMHHPIVIWVGQDDNNFIWSLQYLKELLRRFTHIRHKCHKTEIIYKILKDFDRKISYKQIKFCRCFPNKNKYKHLDTFSAYKQYLLDKKQKTIDK